MFFVLFLFLNYRLLTVCVWVEEGGVRVCVFVCVCVCVLGGGGGISSRLVSLTESDYSKNALYTNRQKNGQFCVLVFFFFFFFSSVFSRL